MVGLGTAVRMFPSFHFFQNNGAQGGATFGDDLEFFLRNVGEHIDKRVLRGSMQLREQLLTFCGDSNDLTSAVLGVDGPLDQSG